MADGKDDKPTRWPIDAPPASPKRPPAPAAAAPMAPAPEQRGAGRIVHDERGNAVWDWLKETSRIAIESTSRLLKRLEVPELKVEGDKDEELRVESDRDAGGGYDPYNQKTPPPKIKPTGRK